MSRVLKAQRFKNEKRGGSKWEKETKKGATDGYGFQGDL
jgi:hypothetical protein